MKVLIVEDETAAYDSLVHLLHEIDPTINIVGNTESVAQTIQWINKKPLLDLILMDIHLSDGSAFLTFDHIEVEVPIIFTTAYDAYAIDAFKVNSIDYLLKPIKKTELEQALAKFKKLSNNAITAYLERITQLSSASTYQDKLLIPAKDKLLPIDLKDVSFFYTTDKTTSIGLNNGERLPYSKSLDVIFSSLNPADFYRANKQFIIARRAVDNITVWFDSRLLIALDHDTPERIYISKNKAAEFKDWFINRPSS
ncbi:LytTR family DNA-binding domain-containing protein [Sphingobacterium sp. UT-1RO-CII-1]|uniref:LytR/AlgR family response regulator transcription factor n=1 Tax=Sphingobacterium sp. UT-1RO-CII-1 TaxID=2995225 RepID=UPI00227CCE52|nr:LytTR family DNA-binding domain-containing protein [Sphingobacterium sp. UT-1RO-CII-1]MCY4778573.1 LytTR family DNA-binding domain-containing protein [Sphingobacterium sp. UT-1RO-CII-1]